MAYGSVWLATATMPRFEAAVGELRADVVVVGGGLIGLTTALLVADEGADVVLLEARRIGSRTSGNTTGKVTAQHGLIYADLAKRIGREKARLYAAANQAGVEEVARLGEGIECELIRAPAYTYTTDVARAHRITAEVAAASELDLAGLGLDVALADPAEVGLPGVVEAVRFDDQIQLHPGLYLAGLAAALKDRGVRVYENSRVVGIHGKVTTDGGATVDARYVVLATLLPIGMTGGYFGRTRPSRSYGVAVRLPEPAPTTMAISIDEQVRSTRPWPGGGPNGLIVVGGSHETGAVEDTKGRYQGLIDWVGSTWGDIEVDYRWSAQDYLTPDRVPYVGRTPESARVLVATGMHKWGLSNGTAAAMLLRDLIAGRDNPWTKLYDARRIGSPRAVAEMLKYTVNVGMAFTAGHLRRTVKGGADRSPVCTHMGCALTWNNADTSWDCPCHGSRFNPDGTILDGPATKPLQLR